MRQKKTKPLTPEQKAHNEKVWAEARARVANLVCDAMLAGVAAAKAKIAETQLKEN